MPPEFGAEASDGCDWGSTVSLHPYFAFNYHLEEPCRHSGINQYGLVGGAIPAGRNPSYYTILLLGGSVAEQLSIAQEPDGALILERALNRKFQSPNGRPFRLLNAAIAAGQQPMQAIFFLLLRDRADAVISLEGYNEHFNFDGGLRLEEPPAIWHQLAAMRKGQPLRFLLIRSIYAGFLGLRNHPVLSRSYAALLFGSAGLMAARILTPAKMEPAFPHQDLAPETRDERYFSAYRSYLESIRALAVERGMPVAFFFQPVPALYKRVTDEEFNVVGPLDYGTHYLRLLAGLKGGVRPLPLFSLLTLFQGVEGTIYSDPIHFSGNGPGYHMLSEAIADRLGSAWRLSRRKE